MGLSNPNKCYNIDLIHIKNQFFWMEKEILVSFSINWLTKSNQCIIITQFTVSNILLIMFGVT